MANKLNILILTIGPYHKYPWYWKYIQDKSGQCEINYKRISIKNKYPQEITTLEFISIIKSVFLEIIRKRYDYVFTFENDWITYSICILQLFGICKNTKHIILQFIMREKTESLKSKLKFAIMNTLFRTTFRIVCSSRLEISYYQNAFNLPDHKFIYIPLSIDPNLFNSPVTKKYSEKNSVFILSVGRSFRDYDTLIKAIDSINIKTVIVASPSNLPKVKSTKNISIKYDISLEDVTELMKKAAIVVIPLQNLNISIGQSVLLQSMALGKPTIVSKIPATIDYIVDGYNGFFVEPGNPFELNKKIKLLVNDQKLRKYIGKNSKYTINCRHLPTHYIESIKKNILFNCQATKHL